jgi:peptidoglycan/LPS O-acetylase OafA/YrhL
MLFWLFTGYGLLWGIVIAGLMHERSAIRTLLEHPAIRHIGTISYSAYLIHILVIGATQKALGEHVWIGMLVSFIATITIATGTYKLVEKPALHSGIIKS